MRTKPVILPYITVYSNIDNTWIYVYVKLKDRKRSLSGKNDHNALGH